MKRKRIAVIGVSALGGGRSGQGIPVLTALFDRLSARHFDIVYYSLTKANPSNIPPAIRVRELLPYRMPWRLKYLFLLVRAIRDHFQRPFSLVFSVSAYPSGLFALVLGRLIRKPVAVQIIASEAARIEQFGYPPERRWLRKLNRLVCHRCDHLVAVADYQRKIALETLQSDRLIEVLPLRIEAQRFRYRRRTISSPIEFLQVGFYSKVKDQDTMFRAMAIVSRKFDCRMTVVGYGFDTPQVRAMLAALGLSDIVKCVGFVPQDELPSYYDRADIFLHTARFETGCAVIQEAMASGVAVCGTDVGILSDIGREYAEIVPVGDAEALASAIMALINDPNRYSRMTELAYEWIAKHDARWAASNYERWLTKVCG